MTTTIILGVLFTYLLVSTYRAVASLVATARLYERLLDEAQQELREANRLLKVYRSTTDHLVAKIKKEKGIK